MALLRVPEMLPKQRGQPVVHAQRLDPVERA
jgi:hypothetical protein